MNDSTIYYKNENMVAREIEDETVLLPIYDTSEEIDCIYSLNKVASRVWELIDGKKTIGEIKKKVLEEFDTTPQEIEEKMDKFLKDLLEIKAIEQLK
jgi:tryptophanyl-tRNA synthetase